jgi:GLPGLI family protein
MKLQAIIFSLVLLLVQVECISQQHASLTEGKIIFEKRVNMFSYLGSGEGSVYEQFINQYKKDHPQFSITQFELNFRNRTSIYKRAQAAQHGDNSLFHNYFDANNIVYADLNQGKSTTQKSVFEEQFLLNDTTQEIDWKITDDLREIAGFECRRANAFIFDSVAVVAFYTPEIKCESGPERFNGLPGMILGIAIPSMHISWFATNVSIQPEEEIKAPEVGKLIERQAFCNVLEAVLKGRVKSVTQVVQLIQL